MTPILRRFAVAGIFSMRRRVVEDRLCVVFTEDDAAGVVPLDRDELRQWAAELLALAREM